MRNGLLRSIIGSLALLLATGAAAETTYKVTATTLNVRSGASTAYGVIGQIHNAQVYASTSSSNGWYRIWFDNRAGWVSGSYIARVSNGWGKVTAATLNVRSGPGTGYATVGQTTSGKAYAVARCSGDWLEIYYGGNKRWVHGAYLAKNGVSCGGGTVSNPSLPTSSVGFVQMPAAGTGFYAYSTASKRWGTPTFVYGVMNAARARAAARAGQPRLGIGNISLAGGGYMSPHTSHQKGKDMDIRPVAATTYEGPLTIADGRYSRSRNEDLMVNFLRKHFTVRQVLFNDSGIYNKYSWVNYYSGHDNHMHVSM